MSITPKGSYPGFFPLLKQVLSPRLSAATVVPTVGEPVKLPPASTNVKAEIGYKPLIATASADGILDQYVDPLVLQKQLPEYSQVSKLGLLGPSPTSVVAVGSRFRFPTVSSFVGGGFKISPGGGDEEDSWKSVSYADSEFGSETGSVNNTTLAGEGAPLPSMAYTAADKLRQPYFEAATTVKADANPLGSGGFAAVHRIKWTSPEGQVFVMAGKFNMWGTVKKTEYALSSMEKEHEYLTKFKGNDCIVQVHPGFVASGDMLGFAMELGSGTLHGNMPTDPDGVKKVASAIFTMLRSLDINGVVHRDLKAENIILVGDRWKLADFGIAAMKGASCPDGGTESMRAPESRIADSDGILRAKSSWDVFSGGLILKQVLLNANPGLLTLDDIAAPELQALVRTVKQMIDPEPENRPVFYLE